MVKLTARSEAIIAEYEAKHGKAAADWVRRTVEGARELTDDEARRLAALLGLRRVVPREGP